MADVSKVTGDGGQQPDTATRENQPEGESATVATVATDEESNSEANDDKKQENKKVDFPVADTLYEDADKNVVSAVNGEGLLIAVPRPIFGKPETEGGERTVVYAGWNSRKHAPLKKSHFATDVVYIYYQAFVARIKAAILVQSAELKEKRASRLKKFGNDKQRKDANKLIKMREAMKLLTMQLEADGVDLSELDD